MEVTLFADFINIRLGRSLPPRKPLNWPTAIFSRSPTASTALVRPTPIFSQRRHHGFDRAPRITRGEIDSATIWLDDRSPISDILAAELGRTSRERFAEFLMSRRLANPPESIRPLGKREANKLDKLQRIQAAAELLFVERGFDSATMRDIAAKAGTALGTLFLYASNKRDLLFLIANDIMEAAVDEATALVESDSPLTYNVTLILGVHFRVFGTKPELFRLVLRELVFYDSGVQGLRSVENRARLLQLFRHLVTSAVRAKQLKPEVDTEMVTRVIFSIIQAEIRRWIATEDRVLSSGLTAIWSAIALLEKGVGVQPGALSPSVRDIRKIVSRLARYSPNE